MNAEILKRAGIDYEGGVKRFVGRAHLYEKALGKFLKDGAFPRLRAAYAADDLPGLLSGAHELKGMCGNIALTKLYEEAEAMVKMLRGGEYARADLDASYARLERAYDETYQAVLAATEDAL